MTIKELDNAFKLYLDKADSQNISDFLPQERERFLNDAQTRLARSVVRDQDQAEGAAELRRTLSTYKALPLATGPYNGDSGKLPEDFLAYGSCRLRLKAPYENYLVTPKLVGEDTLTTLFDDPFNSPTIGEPVVALLLNQLLVFPPKASTELQLTYYKQPAAISLATPTATPEFPAELHPTLVQYAVQLALETISDSRFQTQAAVSKLTETP